MQERRKLARKNLMSYSQVFDLYGGVLLGYLADLTHSGAMVISEKALDTGKELTLQLEVPELEGIDAQKLIIESRVVWCQPDISPNFRNIGLEFKEVTPDQMRVIEAIMEHYEFTHQVPRYPLRPPIKR
jgi:Tfp pilus assembly protein PilZ